MEMTQPIKDDYDFSEFARVILGIDLAFLALISYPAIHFWGLVSLLSIGAGLLIPTVNFLAGYFVISRFFCKTFDLFTKVVFASMALRMMVLLIITMIFILFIKIDQISFIISLFISYICKSVIEIYYISKKSRKTGVTSNID